MQQERLEFNRQNRSEISSAVAAAPDAMDNETFFMNLPPDLRRNILSDMDDSLVSHLPERMRSEAQALRQERDTRRRQILEQRHAMLERMMEEAHVRLSHGGSGGGAGGGSGESRRSYIGRREADIFTPSNWPTPASTQGMRYAVVNLNPHMLDMPTIGGLPPGLYNLAGRVGGGGGSGSLSIHHSKLADQSSKQMLDQEALVCLLVLLFLDQNKLHNNRLHRIIRNLSQHSPTRAWILSSLLAIIKEMRKSPGSSSDPPPIPNCPMPPTLVPRGRIVHSDFSSTSTQRSEEMLGVTSSSLASGGVVSCTPVVVSSQQQAATSHWLDMSINAALGSHAKIFQFSSGSSPTGKGGKGGSSSACSSVGDDISSKVNIHPLAATSICHNILDLLVFLGRNFSSSFLPSELLPRVGGGGDKGGSGDGEDEQKKKEEAAGGEVIVTNFWQILLKLDSASGRKGKGALKGFKYSGLKSVPTNQSLFSNSILGQLMGLLSLDIIIDNPSLVDKLLRTLSIASNSIPRNGLKSAGAKPQPSAAQDSSAPGGSSSEKQDPAGGAELTDNVTSKDSYSSDMSIVAPPLLQNVVSVLISGRCSEEGLEEATTLLTNLSKSSIPTREAILFMLLDGVRTIGRTLCSQIAVLLDAVTVVVQDEALESGSGMGAFDSIDGLGKNGRRKGGKLANLSGSGGANALAGVVLPSSNPDDQQHTDHSHDLHIPAMEPLTCKGSQQSFFVRMLKVVCQLRESAQQAVMASKPPATATATAAGSTGNAAESSSNSNAVDNPTDSNPADSNPADSNPADSNPTDSNPTSNPADSNPADSLAANTSSTPDATQQVDPAASSMVVEPSETRDSNPPDASSSEPGSSQVQASKPSTSASHEPEVLLSLAEESGSAGVDSKPSFLKQTLSLQLELEELWTVLSECLSALSRTEDPHAVFVLQPTVEAFFLVHANYKEESSESKKRAQDALRTRLSRISSLHGASDSEGIPTSPAPFSPLPGTPGPGEGNADPFAHLPPDTARFLKFAGTSIIGTVAFI